MEWKCSAGSMNGLGAWSQESGVGADSLTAGSRLQPPAQGSDQSTKHLGDSVARVQKLSLIIFGYVFQPTRDLDLGFPDSRLLAPDSMFLARVAEFVDFV